MNLVEERFEVKAELDRLKARLAEIDSELREKVAAGELEAKSLHGDLVLSVRPGNARINQQELEKEYPVEWFPELYESKVVAARVRELVQDVERFEVRGADVVSVKKLEL